MQALVPVTLLSALGAGALVSSSRPAQSQIAVTPIVVDAAANRHPINPEVYGVNLATPAQLQELNAPLNRNGGNNTSRYNWQQNADNRAFDWYFESIPESSPLPGGRGDSFISDAKSNSAQPMLTIPMIDWIAKLGPNRGKLASFSIAKYGAQTGRDSAWFPDAGNGISAATGQPITGNDPNDANVPNSVAFQQGWVQQLVAKWGQANQGGLKYYILDNEPSIWFSTHRDVSPVGMKMEEMRDRMIQYGQMIKAQDPSAQVVGPEEWGWSGFIFSGYDQQWGSKYGWGGALPDRSSHGGMDYLPWLLDQLHKHEQATGQRVLDVFTVHYYPQSGEYSNDVSQTIQLRRNRSTRSLWDPNYTDESWIQNKVQLVPRLRNWVNTYYPGTKIGLTEYSWGADNHINGATAQADIYGILGREGIDLATRWTTPDRSTPTFQAMKLYRNYDGNKSTFGDQSVAASVPNPDNLSAFAAVRSSDQALTVMVINKIATATPISVSLSNYSTNSSSAQLWQLAAGTGIQRLADVSVAGGAIETTVPAQSISLFVIGGAAAPPPTTPAFFATASANPAAVTATGTSTLSVDLTDTGAALTGGTVSLEMVDPSGVTAGQKQFPAQDFAAGQTRSYAYAWTAPATVGTYTLKVRVLDADGTTAYYQNENATTVAVSAQAPAPVFTATATASPTSIPTGGASTITATVKNTGGDVPGSIVDIEVYNSSGAKVAQQVYDAQSFTSGQTRTYTYGWTAPGTPGTYTVKLGIFSADWSKNYTWNDQAATISVTGTVTMPAFTATVTAAQKPATAQVPVALTATVKDIGAAATGAIVDVEIVGPSGARVFQQIFSGQDFTSGQTRTYSLNWTPPATAGKYVIGVGVFAKDWTAQYTWVSGAGSVDVVTGAPAPPSFTGSATLSPASVTAGGAVTASATFTNSGGGVAGTALDLELYDSAGSRVGQKWIPAQDFAAGESRTVSWAFTAPATAGSYQLKLGVFAADGATQLYWNNAAGTLTVTAPPSVPTFTSTVTASPASLASGATTTLALSVKDTGGALSGGVVVLEVANASGQVVTQQVYSAQSFTTGQTLSYSYTWTAPQTTGTYTVKVGVYGAGQTPQYHSNPSAATVTVTAPATAPTFTSSASVGSGPFKVGKVIPITVSVKDTGAPLPEGLIDVVVFDAAGNVVLQQVFTGQSFATGQTRSYLVNWTPKATGAYQIHVGIFGKNWSPQYDWNWQAGAVTVK